MSDRKARLTWLAQDAAACTECGLHESRDKSVFSRGDPHSALVFVGEGPGANEDEQGVPFVGQAGQLLDKMIAAMGFARDAVYVCNAVKCRPPENRTPLVGEIRSCYGFLYTQLALVRPKVIVALGKTAVQVLTSNLHDHQAINLRQLSGDWRGRWTEWIGPYLHPLIDEERLVVPVMPTYHPAYLLRSPEQKKTVGQDLKKVLNRLATL